jgi:FkbM family methyltransferase
MHVRDIVGQTWESGGAMATKSRLCSRLMRMAAYGRAFGLIRGAIALHRIRARTGSVTIDVPGLRAPVAVRPGSTDVFSFEDVFVHGLHELDMALEPSLIVDCGANVGYVSILFASRYPGAQVVALEPEASNVAILRRNAAAYANIDVIEGAVWSTNGRLRIRNVGAAYDAFQVEPDAQGEIRAFTIDSLMRRYGATDVDVLKIDIEGAEREIFRERPSWLEHVRILLIELHDRFEPGCSKAFYDAIAGYDFVEIKRGISFVFVNRALRPTAVAACA